MRFHAYVITALVALAMAVNIPNIGLAEDNPPVQEQAQPGGQVPKPVGGVATVVGVDQPENCLRIWSGPGISYDVVGCAKMGEELHITGVWTSNGWGQLADNGWVYGSQIKTDLRPPQTAFSETRTYVVTEKEYPVNLYTYDYGWLPDYGYETYWWGAIPIIVYAANVWWRCHPWWWCKNWDRIDRAWNWSRNAQTDPRSGTARNFTATNRSNVSRNFTTTNRSNFSSSNINRFSSNALRSTRSFSTPYMYRTFSSPRAFSMGSSGVRSFGGFSGRGFSGGIGGGHHR